MKLHLFLVLFAAQSLRADWVIVENNIAGDQNKPTTIKIKDNLIRSDMGDKMTVLLNATDGSVQMFMHAKKTLIRVNPATLKSMSALAGKFLAGGDDGLPVKPKATGEKVKVGEWDAEVYTWQSKIGSGKFYLSKDFPHFSELNAAMEKISKSMGNPMSSLYPSYADFPGMVVKSEMSMMGKPTTTELVSVKEGPLSDADFKAPEGYTEMKLPSFPGGAPASKP